MNVKRWLFFIWYIYPHPTLEPVIKLAIFTLSPRYSLSFMTEINSWWLSTPSPSSSNNWKTTWIRWAFKFWPIHAFTALWKSARTAIYRHHHHHHRKINWNCRLCLTELQGGALPNRLILKALPLWKSFVLTESTNYFTKSCRAPTKSCTNLSHPLKVNLTTWDLGGMTGNSQRNQLF